MRDPGKYVPRLAELAGDVGLFQLSEFRKRSAGWGDRKAAKELVSFVDVESEKRIALALGALLPEAAFFGEETSRDRGELTWVVDPLDGTTKYCSGLDLFSVSIALYEGDRPVLGMVHRPSPREWYWAVRGGGAWFRAEVGPPRRIPAAGPFPLADSVVCTGTPYRSTDTSAAFFGAAEAVVRAALDLRRLGSAALDLAWVADGRLQAFWEVDLEAYDVGAAVLLLEEAGCPLTTIGGAPYDPFASRSLATGRPGAAEELRSLIAPFYASTGRL